PVVLDLRNKSRRQDQIDRPAAKDLIGYVYVAALRIVCRPRRHCTVSLRSVTQAARAISFNPFRAAPGAGPDHRKIAFIKHRIVGALITAINVAAGTTAEENVLGQQVYPVRAPRSAAGVIGGRAVPRFAAMENAGAGGH